MIKEEYKKEISKFYDETKSIFEIKELIKLNNNQIIYNFNESKKYKNNEIVELITYSLIWVDEYIEEIKKKEKNKDKIKENEKEINNKKEINIILIMMIILVNCIILLKLI